MRRSSRLTEGVLQEDWPEARGRERRPRAEANSLCTRAATGSPVGHYDPATEPSEEGKGARRPNRRRGEAPRGERLRHWARSTSVRCFSRAASWHAKGAAIRTRASRRFVPSRRPEVLDHVAGEPRRTGGNGRRDDRSPDESPGCEEGTQSPAHIGRREHRDDRRDGRSVASGEPRTCPGGSRMGCLTS